MLLCPQKPSGTLHTAQPHINGSCSCKTLLLKIPYATRHPACRDGSYKKDAMQSLRCSMVIAAASIGNNNSICAIVALHTHKNKLAVQKLSAPCVSLKDC